MYTSIKKISEFFFVLGIFVSLKKEAIKWKFLLFLETFERRNVVKLRESELLLFDCFAKNTSNWGRKSKIEGEKDIEMEWE